jgi:carboxylesterase type B
MSEDCLFLNVWAAEKSGEKRPVLVWFHGGAFSEGSGSLPSFDGETLARKGLVVVTINYRLSVFGFLAHPELTGESVAGSSGNYGLLDQIAALKWVGKNIAAFGGDPERVTIAGQSAGSSSVHFLEVSPLMKLYVYYFSRKSPGRDSERIGAFHSGELEYVFGTLNATDRPWEPVDRKLSDTMSSYWANFVATGDPNGMGLPKWPLYAENLDQFMGLGESIGPLTIMPEKAKLEFFESYFAKLVASAR